MYCSIGEHECLHPVLLYAQVVNKTCSDESIYAAVERYDAETEGRFAKCPKSQPGGGRNTSGAWPCGRVNMLLFVL